MAQKGDKIFTDPHLSMHGVFFIKEGGGGESFSIMCGVYIWEKYMNPKKMAHHGISIFFR